MQIAYEKTVREIALESPSSIRVFERFGIDYCCGGNKSLGDACSELQLSLEQVKEKLDEAFQEKSVEDPDKFQQMTLEKLIQHIVRVHHHFVRTEMPRLGILAEKVAAKHGDTHPELKKIRTIFTQVSAEMTMHMMKEEEILFPYIARLEQAFSSHQDVPASPFGTVSNPIQMMMREHESAGGAMAEISTLSAAYTPPTGACPSYQGLFSGLKDFEQDLHRHVHLENNILFPRAQEMEMQSQAKIA